MGWALRETVCRGLKSAVLGHLFKIELALGLECWSPSSKTQPFFSMVPPRVPSLLWIWYLHHQNEREVFCTRSLGLAPKALVYLGADLCSLFTSALSTGPRTQLMLNETKWKLPRLAVRLYCTLSTEQSPIIARAFSLPHTVGAQHHEISVPPLFLER